MGYRTIERIIKDVVGMPNGGQLGVGATVGPLVVVIHLGEVSPDEEASQLESVWCWRVVEAETGYLLPGLQDLDFNVALDAANRLLEPFKAYKANQDEETAEPMRVIVRQVKATAEQRRIELLQGTSLHDLCAMADVRLRPFASLEASVTDDAPRLDEEHGLEGDGHTIVQRGDRIKIPGMGVPTFAIMGTGDTGEDKCLGVGSPLGVMAQCIEWLGL